MPPKSTLLETQIDENLRLIFEKDAEAELPQRLRDLLDRLDEVDAPAESARSTPVDGTEGRS